MEKLLREFFERMNEVEEKYGVDVAIDDAAIVAIPTVRDEDDEDSESIMAISTSQRGHVQVGMLRLAALRAERDFIKQLDDDDEEDDDDGSN